MTRVSAQVDESFYAWPTSRAQLCVHCFRGLQQDFELNKVGPQFRVGNANVRTLMSLPGRTNPMLKNAQLCEEPILWNKRP